MNADQLKNHTDDQARQLFDILVRRHFGTVVAFAAHVGISKQTAYQWARPPAWALVYLTTLEEGKQNRGIVGALQETMRGV